MSDGDPLRDRFMAALAPALRTTFADLDELDAALAELVEQGRRAWHIELDAGAFVEHVAGCVTSATSIAELHAADLYLAFGCAKGDPAALRVLERRFFPQLGSLFGGWRLPSTTEDEFLQAMREHLLVGEAPRISRYAGRGRLASWVRMSGARLLTDISRRRTGPGELVHRSDALVAALTPTDDPSAGFLKARYRPEVQAAIEDALATLEPRARNLLRQRFIHGLQLDDIATLHGVHRVTVSKRLARARRDVVAGLRRGLAARLGTTKLDVDTIIRLCSSQLDLSLEDALGS